MLCEALDNIFQGEQQFLKGIHISRPVKCQMKMIAQGTRKTKEYVETRTQPQRPSPNNP
jgi:hypothetical protein